MSNPPIVIREMTAVAPSYAFMRYQRGYWHQKPDADINGFYIGSESPRFHLLANSSKPFANDKLRDGQP